MSRTAAKADERDESSPNFDIGLDASQVANRRSLSFQREPRSPSWNNANFDSSAESDNTGNDKSNTSMSELSAPALTKQSASQPVGRSESASDEQLPCFNVIKAEDRHLKLRKK